MAAAGVGCLVISTLVIVFVLYVEPSSIATVTVSVLVFGTMR